MPHSGPTLFSVSTSGSSSVQNFIYKMFFIGPRQSEQSGDVGSCLPRGGRRKDGDRKDTRINKRATVRVMKTNRTPPETSFFSSSRLDISLRVVKKQTLKKKKETKRVTGVCV
ncbi:hypothetical protein E3U43_022626 [Larimichthys crocea]|uniref:Uncharacterized protein n=1 Tax=Larimichthys crocea TaxID=215358 RepID=A0ACD3R596_LARCR|nr:hypothetical protein E3U43_022626 [Larimichthys crocea]